MPAARASTLPANCLSRDWASSFTSTLYKSGFALQHDKFRNCIQDSNQNILTFFISSKQMVYKTYTVINLRNEESSSKESSLDDRVWCWCTKFPVSVLSSTTFSNMHIRWEIYAKCMSTAFPITAFSTWKARNSYVYGNIKPSAHRSSKTKKWHSMSWKMTSQADPWLMALFYSSSNSVKKICSLLWFWAF